MAQFVPAEAFDLVIFGGTGDLSQRKLLPALFHRDRDGQFTPDSRIFAVSRSELAPEAFVDFVREALERHLPEGEFDAETWERFARRLHYLRLDVTTPEGWDALSGPLDAAPQHIRVFYLATLPSLYGPAAGRLAAAKLIDDRTRIVRDAWSGTGRNLDGFDEAVRVDGRLATAGVEFAF